MELGHFAFRTCQYRSLTIFPLCHSHSLSHKILHILIVNIAFCPIVLSWYLRLNTIISDTLLHSSQNVHNRSITKELQVSAPLVCNADTMGTMNFTLTTSQHLQLNTHKLLAVLPLDCGHGYFAAALAPRPSVSSHNVMRVVCVCMSVSQSGVPV